MKTAEIDLTVAQGAAEKHPSIVTEEAATSRKEAELQAVVTQLTDEIEEMLNKHEKYDKVLKLGEDLDRLKSCADSLNISEEEIDTLDEKELEYDLARVDAELGDKLSTIMRVSVKYFEVINWLFIYLFSLWLLSTFIIYYEVL